jgi:diguanylate cyclase (GGDEF)-like protein
MKISQRLTALSAFSAAGLLCVSAVSYFAVTSIQSDLRTLTMYATPLQNKTYEMQDRTERWLGGLLKLSLAHERGEVDKALEGIHVDSAAIDRLGEEIRGLDPMARVNATEFRVAQGEIVRAVQRRLGDEAGYRQETEHARLALQRAEATIALTRSNVAGIAAEASRTADEAQEASRRLASVTKVALSAQTRLKEIAMLVAEADLATNRFRLTPLRDKIRAATDSIQRLEIDAGSDDPIKELKSAAADVYELFINDSQGLLAAREAVLAKKADAEVLYQRQRRALLARLDEQSTKLGLLIDGTEAQAYQQRRSLEAALRLRGEPGGVIAVSEEVSLGMREMGAALRELMLAVTPAECTASESRLKTLETELVTNMGAMRAALHKMGRPQLTANVDAALAAMASVAASIENVAAAKRSLLDSEARTNASLAHLKATAALQASAGERQVKDINERQAEVTSAVDRRVGQTLLVILALSSVIIALSTAVSIRTVRGVTRGLNEAVRVAEAVSQGRLDPVACGSANDETTRLLVALGSMVNTIRTMLGSLHETNSQLIGANDELRRRAFLDPLTDLPNRTLFEDRLSHAVARNARSDERVAERHHEKLAVMFVDLDGFKPVNDCFGHGVGDIVLKEVAQRMRGIARKSDTVARVGGDEFLLLMEDAVSAADVATLARRVIEALQQPFEADGQRIEVSASIGVAIYPEHGDRAKLIAHADAAMYAAKRTGGNTFALFEAHMETDPQAELNLQSDLRHAVQRGELMLHYQPKVDGAGGQILGVEALLRWKHPQRGLVGPNVFIPLAERFGLICQIGAWVIEEACRQMHVWSTQGMRMRVAINLSAHQLRDETLAERICQALERHEVDPAYLLCEITESVAMEDIEVTQRAFEGLATIGVYLSIDDFGTGYSSLSYLRQLPARQLKIDRSFVKDLEESRDARAVVEAVVDLAHALELSVVAEGVETEGQREILVRLGCDELQGFLFARPMPANDLLQWAQGRRQPTGRPESAASVIDESPHAPEGCGLVLGGALPQSV